MSQRVTVPSLTLSPNAGIVITVPEPEATGATGATGAAAATGATTGGATGAGVCTTAGATTGAGVGADAFALSAMIASSAPTATV